MSFKLGTAYEQVKSSNVDYTAGKDDDVVNVGASTGARVVTLTEQSNSIVAVRKTDSSANSVTISATKGGSSTTINAASTYVLSAQNQCALFRRLSSGEWLCLEDNGANAVVQELVALAAAIPTTTVASLTENAGSIGGTNDGDLPDLTATYVARTGTPGAADGAMQTVGATNSGDVSAAINNNFQELLAVVAQLAADNVALRAAARENAARSNTILSRLKTATIIA